MNAVIPSEEQVVQWITSLSNWGRWGEDDQYGCLNLITPEKRKQAAVLVQDGITESCVRPITTEITPDITYQVQRYMVDSGEGRDTDPPERRRVRRGAAEFIGMVFHGQTITHIDALSHYSWQGVMYNGKPSSFVTSREGAQSHSIEAAADGIVTRGVLLDIPQVRGISWPPADEPVMPEDLEAAEQQAGVRVEAGDILFVRTGNYRKILEQGPVPGTVPMTACQVACTPWFKERDIAMLGTDTSNDVRPSHYANIVKPCS
jgi:kynurenine formamidase